LDRILLARASPDRFRCLALLPNNHSPNLPLNGIACLDPLGDHHIHVDEVGKTKVLQPFRGERGPTTSLAVDTDLFARVGIIRETSNHFPDLELQNSPGNIDGTGDMTRGILIGLSFLSRAAFRAFISTDLIDFFALTTNSLTSGGNAGAFFSAANAKLDREKTTTRITARVPRFLFFMRFHLLSLEKGNEKAGSPIHFGNPAVSKLFDDFAKVVLPTIPL
jgi:hypothetical protein